MEIIRRKFESERVPQIEESLEPIPIERTQIPSREPQQIGESWAAKCEHDLELAKMRDIVMEEEAFKEYLQVLEKIEAELDWIESLDQKTRGEILESSQKECDQILSEAAKSFLRIHGVVTEKFNQGKKLIKKEYTQIIDTARQKYEQIEKLANKKLDSTRFAVSHQSAHTAACWEKYERITDPAWAEYKKVEKSSQERHDRAIEVLEEECDQILKLAEEQRIRITISAAEDSEWIKRLISGKRDYVIKSAKKEYLQTRKNIQEKTNQIKLRILEQTDWQLEKGNR